MDDARTSKTTTTRRAFVKGAVAVGTGAAAAAYVTPSLRSLGIAGALAQVSRDPLDSSTTGSGDPVPPSSSIPQMPSTGGGGMAADASVDSASIGLHSKLVRIE